MKHLTDKIFLIGGMGAGKTTVGVKLAHILHYKFYDIDKEIEKATGVDIPWIFEIEGEEGFRKREQKILRKLANKSQIVLATGGGTILDIDNRHLLINNGLVIYLKTTVEHQLRRLTHDKRRPLLQVENRDEVLSKIMSEREPLYSSMADIIIETGDRSITSVLNNIMKVAFEVQD
ncbi:MAG: shikimate kinase AroK [Legionellales bacterium]|nr:shikimate kinase AroK [Legionellales bacterium]